MTSEEQQLEARTTNLFHFALPPCCDCCACINIFSIKKNSSSSTSLILYFFFFISSVPDAQFLSIKQTRQRRSAVQVQANYSSILVLEDITFLMITGSPRKPTPQCKLDREITNQHTNAHKFHSAQLHGKKTVRTCTYIVSLKNKLNQQVNVRVFTWQYDTELCCYRRPIKSSLGSVSNTVDAAVCNNLCKLIELAWQVTYLSMKH